MFRKKTTATATSLDNPKTIIGSGIYIEAAKMTGQESIRIDGIFKGSIEVEGNLVLGESGSITGNVRANYFLVAGEVTGNITCTSQVHFASTAKVEGDIETSSLIVDEGSKVSGKYTVGTDRLSQNAIASKDEPLRIAEDVKDALKAIE